MKPESKDSFEKLEKSLDELVKVYRHVLTVVRKERDILVASQLEELNENNRTKEAMFIKARQLEEERQKAAIELAVCEGLTGGTKLVDFANHFGGEVGERLRSRQAVLELLLRRVREHNQHNETLVKSALENITGAIGSIRDQLRDKPTYRKSGGMVAPPTASGQLVSKEG
jgi:flagellar biosynthesis/type III secretory pathway chaperone